MLIKLVNIAAFVLILLLMGKDRTEECSERLAISSLIKQIRHAKCDNMEYIIRTMNMPVLKDDREYELALVKLCEPLSCLSTIKEALGDIQIFDNDRRSERVSMTPNEKTLYSEMVALDQMIYLSQHLFGIGYCGVYHQRVFVETRNDHSSNEVVAEAFVVDIPTDEYILDSTGYRAKTFKIEEVGDTSLILVVYQYNLTVGDTIEVPYLLNK